MALADQAWQGGSALHDLTFADSDHIAGVVFPPGGQTVYVQLQPTVLNLWAAGVHYWPELLAALAGLIVLVFSALVLRIARRPQQVGAWYCRRCGYCLSGAPDPHAATCPECGVSTTKRRPRRGRARWKRALPAVILGSAGVVGYVALHVVGVPREGRFAKRCILHWDPIQRAAESRGWAGLLKFKGPIERVVEVDIRSGRTLRTLYESGLAPAPELSMRLSDDGRDLITMDADGSLACRDAERGSVRSRLPLPERCLGTSSQWTHVAGFGDGGIAYVALCDTSDWTSRLVEWDTRAGTSRDLLVEPAYRWTLNNGDPWADGRSFTVLHGNGPRFVSTPKFMEAYHNKFNLRAYDAAGAPLWEANASGEVSPSANLAPTSDGTRGYMSCMHRGIWGIDLRTGKGLGLLPPPSMDAGWDELAPSDDGRLIFWSTVTTNQILIYEVASGKWLTPLTYTTHVVSPLPYPSADGRWLAAIGITDSSSTPAPTTDPFLGHLLLFDVSGCSPSPEGR